MITTQTLKPEAIRWRWPILSNPQKATLDKADQAGKEVVAHIAEYPFGNYLLALEVK